MKALYIPDQGLIACVLVQAGAGGSPEVAKMFDTSDWFLAPNPKMRMMNATEDQWRFIARMTREERIKRWRKS